MGDEDDDVGPVEDEAETESTEDEEDDDEVEPDAPAVLHAGTADVAPSWPRPRRFA